LEVNFLDELLQEAELKEEEQTEAYFDLLLLQIKQLTKQIEYNFSQSEKECSMINSFILHKNAQLQEKIRWCNAPPKAREKLGQKSREKLNDIFIC